MRTAVTVLVAPLALVLPLLGGCCVLINTITGQPCAEPPTAEPALVAEGSIEQLGTSAYPAYAGSDTETIEVIDLVPHLVSPGAADGTGSYLAFRHNPRNPGALGVSGLAPGQICACDVASATRLPESITAADGARKVVTRLVVRSGSVVERVTTPCPTG